MWYSTGTVAVTNNSKNVVGTGTSWFDSLQNGWGFIGPDGRIDEVESVNSATSLTLRTAYMGASAGTQTYSAFPTMSLAGERHRCGSRCVVSGGSGYWFISPG